ncbi:MAG: hypothetical protein LBI06_05165, partial [Treponema sp.]|nr:hypothetical protein [Treponema sp.]
MEKVTSEILEVNNFLSIVKIRCEFEQFNIITGDMAAGKSLCIKLVKFFEDIIPEIFTSSNKSFCKFLDGDYFLKYLAEKFTTIFVFSMSEPAKRKRFSINYSFSYYKKETFSVSISGSHEDDITVKSHYLEGL